jgi:hypothetical protein
MALRPVIQGFFPGGLSRIASPPVARQPLSANSNAVPLPAPMQRFATGNGQPLPADVRQQMESVFGAKFGDVRVHVGPQAATLGALAFTNGSDIHFAPGHYNPQTPRGRQILAHELAHVVQQRAGRVRNPFGSGVAVVQDRMLETEADRFAQRAITHRPPPKPTARPLAALQAKMPPRRPAPPKVAAYRSAIQLVRKSARIASTGYMHSVLGIINGIRKFFQTIDKHGNYYWDGRRNSLSFTSVTKLAMAGTKGNGCALGSCSNAANGIDHIVDFATTQSSLATETYCDASDHWDGVPWQDAQDDYNNLSNLQWACTSCNSSKSGARGLYTPPQHAGSCPGALCTL